MALTDKERKKMQDAKFEMATLFYGGLLTIVAFIIAWLFCSCSNNDIEEVASPTFKVTSYSKELIDGTYNCKAVIAITNIPEEYSIDGLLYADDIQGMNVDLPFNEEYRYDTHLIENGKMYFNISGKHHGDITIKISWTSKENLRNYLIGWHMCYGFGDNCQVLMVDLDSQITNN